MVAITTAVITLELAFMIFATGQQECTDKVTTAIGQGALFVTFIASQFIQWRREARNRKWAKEDAEALARKTEETARTLAKKTEDVAEDVKSATKDALAEHEENVAVKLDDQTKALQQSMRTRVTDLGKNLDALVTEGPKRRKTDV
jgi:biopolymer transport protein ExbB/TolQ